MQVVEPGPIFDKRSVMLQRLHALFLLFPMFICSGPVSAEFRELSFGVVPQQPPSRLVAIWGPMLEEVSKISGIALRFETAGSIPEFERRVAEGRYDIAYMNPYHFTIFNTSPGYRAMVRAKDRSIRGLLVVRKDSQFKDLRDLAGKQLAFPSPAAFAATLLVQSHLNQANIEYHAKYVNSHDSVYLGVAKGLYPAGGGIERTLHSATPELREQLRILWTSQSYTPHAIAAHPRVPEAQVERVKNALVKLGSAPAGPDILNKLSLKGWEAAQDQEWDNVRQLNIRLLVK